MLREQFESLSKDEQLILRGTLPTPAFRRILIGELREVQSNLQSLDFTNAARLQELYSRLKVKEQVLQEFLELMQLIDNLNSKQGESNDSSQSILKI